MVFVEKPDMEAEVENTKGPCSSYQAQEQSRMVICGNRQPWEADERTSTNNLDASLLRWMLSTLRRGRRSHNIFSMRSRGSFQ
eukprot:3773174-Amphidinium_carterae.1